VTKCHWNII